MRIWCKPSVKKELVDPHLRVFLLDFEVLHKNQDFLQNFLGDMHKKIEFMNKMIGNMHKLPIFSKTTNNSSPRER
jgi:hypothetical protein